MTQPNLQVNEFINELPAWQKAVCIRVRQLIHQAEPEIEEVIKRTRVPFFVLNGSVCAFQATKNHVNILIYDPIAPDPHGIINQGNGNKTARAIQIYENDTLNEAAFIELIREVANSNRESGWRKRAKSL